MRFHFDNLNALQEQFNQLVEDAYGKQPATGFGRYRDLDSTQWLPPVEAWETEKEIFLSLDLPGISAEELELQIEGDQLTIKGERKPSDDQRNYRRKEKVYGRFYRAFNLTTPVEKDKVTATYKNGVIEIVLPKTEAEKPKQIKISVEE